MTEDEAKTKWCPFARVADTSEHTAAVANRYVTPDDGIGIAEGSQCLASGCMAFRWGIGNEHDGYFEVAPRRGVHPDPALKYGGYCGLAGKP